MPPPLPRPTREAPSRDWIAFTLAVGLCTALNAITVGVMIAAFSRDDYSLSENATQILTGWGGGVIGILGAVFGYRAGADHAAPPTDPAPPAVPTDDTEP